MNTQLEHDLCDFICSDFANYEQDIAGRSISIEYVLGYKQAGTINFKFKISDYFVLYTLHVYGMSRDENKMLNIKRQMTRTRLSSISKICMIILPVKKLVKSVKM